jgi:RIO kinase 1
MEAAVSDDTTFDEASAGTGEAWFDELFSEGLVTELIKPIKSGKEASVYLCRANPALTGALLLAAKAYRPPQHRTFHNTAAYLAGRVILNGHTRRAVAKKTGFGRQFEEASWIFHEWEMLSTLHPIGVDLPRPVRMVEGAILMEYLGDEEAPAAQLKDIEPSSAEARALFDRLMWNVELLLASNVVHSDLSPYNVLVEDDRLTLIDFPQAVDPRSNRNARDLLARDVSNLCRWFARFGGSADRDRLTAGLWNRFLFADNRPGKPPPLAALDGSGGGNLGRRGRCSECGSAPPEGEQAEGTAVHMCILDEWLWVDAPAGR